MPYIQKVATRELKELSVFGNDYDTKDGTGVRVSIYVSGCHFHCKGCHNKEAWDFNYGEEFTDATIETVLKSMEPDYISGLTLLGGEPMEPVNQRALLPLLCRFQERFPKKNIWCYTGYTYEDDLLNPDGKAHCEVTDEFLSYIDILVDGEFDQDLYDISLKFRGSKNQRILQIHKVNALYDPSVFYIQTGDNPFCMHLPSSHTQLFFFIFKAPQNFSEF